MYHPFYKIYFKRIKSNFEKSDNFVVKCLDFLKLWIKTIMVLDTEQTLRCIRLIEIKMICQTQL